MRQTLVIKFKIFGNLIYLSHHETVSLFQRALVRSGIDLCYTEGFNPRPRLSLPLPRSVGVLSDAEMFYALVSGVVTTDGGRLQKQIGEQLPVGCEVTGVELENGKVSYRAEWAEYEFDVGEMVVESEFKSEFERLCLTVKSVGGLYVERRKGESESFKRIDVSSYIETAELTASGVLFRCGVTPSGSVRTDELLGLLGLERGQLSGPIRRIAVGWQKN